MHRTIFPDELALNEILYEEYIYILNTHTHTQVSAHSHNQQSSPSHICTRIHAHTYTHHQRPEFLTASQSARAAHRSLSPIKTMRMGKNEVKNRKGKGGKEKLTKLQ